MCKILTSSNARTRAQLLSPLNPRAARLLLCDAAVHEAHSAACSRRHSMQRTAAASVVEDDTSSTMKSTGRCLGSEKDKAGRVTVISTTPDCMCPAIVPCGHSMRTAWNSCQSSKVLCMDRNRWASLFKKVTHAIHQTQKIVRHIIASFKNRWRMACTTIAITMSFPACLETDL